MKLSFRLSLYMCWPTEERLRASQISIFTNIVVRKGNLSASAIRSWSL